MVLVGTEHALKSVPITSESGETLTSLHVASIVLLKLQTPTRHLGLITAAEEVTLLCISRDYLSIFLVQERSGDTWPHCFHMKDSELQAASLPLLMMPAPLGNPLPTVTQRP